MRVRRNYLGHVLHARMQLRFVMLATELQVASFDITVAGQPLSAPIVIAVAPPMVVTMDIDVLRSGGDIFFLSVTGYSFGQIGGQVAISETLCQVVSWTHVHIECLALVRFGVLVVSSSSVRVSNGVAYDVDLILLKPSILHASPARVPTAGGVLLVLVGTAFKMNGTILVDPGTSRERTCDWNVVGGAYNDTMIVCAVPAYNGAVGMSIVVRARQVESVPFTGVVYLPPQVESLSPSASSTDGGTLLNISGANFGSIGGDAFVGDVLCPIVLWTDIRVVCRIPAGSTGSFVIRIVVAGQASASSNSVFQYTSPRVTSVAPNHSPSEGQIVLFVRGVNFGVGIVTVALADAARNFLRVSRCDVLFHNHTVAACVLSAAGGRALAVVLNAGGVQSNVDVTFSYDLPNITHLLSTSRPAAGGVTLSIYGSSFTEDATVMIGSTPCPVMVSNHTIVTCVLPPRFAHGDGNLTLSAMGQIARVGFEYDLPVIFDISPNTADANVGGDMTMTGINFGVDAASAVTVFVGAKPARFFKRLGDSSVSCTFTGPFVVGPTNISVDVDGRSSNNKALLLLCGSGYFGGVGEVCKQCPRGAVCAGGGSDPVALPGFFKIERTMFLTCSPAEACPGGEDTICSPRYTGVPCNTCAPRHYRLQLLCVPCPQLAVIYLIAFFVALIILFGIAAYLNKRKVNLAALGIGLDAMQAIAQIGSFRFAWPKTVAQVFSYISATSLNIEIVAPECAVQWSFRQKWLITNSIPFLMAFMGVCAIMVACVVSFRKRYRLGLSFAPRALFATKTVANAKDLAMGVVFSGLYYLYFIVLRNTLALFACTTNEDGVSTLDADPSVSCTDPGSVRGELLPLGYAAIGLYGLGIPVLFGFVIFLHLPAMRADQVLRRDSSGDSEASNPSIRVRRKFRKLYEDFTPEHVYWRLVLIARKAALAVTALLFAGQPMFQGSVSCSVLFMAFVMHAHAAPFIARRAVSERYAAYLREVARRSGVDLRQVADSRRRGLQRRDRTVSDGMKDGGGRRRAVKANVTEMLAVDEAVRAATAYGGKQRRASATETLLSNPHAAAGIFDMVTYDYNRLERWLLTSMFFLVLGARGA